MNEVSILKRINVCNSLHIYIYYCVQYCLAQTYHITMVEMIKANVAFVFDLKLGVLIWPVTVYCQKNSPFLRQHMISSSPPLLPPPPQHVPPFSFPSSHSLIPFFCPNIPPAPRTARHKQLTCFCLFLILHALDLFLNLSYSLWVLTCVTITSYVCSHLKNRIWLKIVSKIMINFEHQSTMCKWCVITLFKAL